VEQRAAETQGRFDEDELLAEYRTYARNGTPGPIPIRGKVKALKREDDECRLLSYSEATLTLRQFMEANPQATKIIYTR
jgi:hypothetical protein